MTVGPEPPHFDALELGPNIWLTRGHWNEWEFDAPSVALAGDLTLNALIEPPEEVSAMRDALAKDAFDAETVAEVGTPNAALAARLLLIHRWRRFVLRHPDLPPPVARPDLRVAVGEAYRALLPLSRRWLDAEVEGMTALPPMSADSRERFA